MKITDFKTLVFDCDGVILNSNRVKTNAFYTAALPYGEEPAQELADYHVTNGGISRYKKFDYFLQKIIGKAEPGDDELEQLLEAYAAETWKGLINCKIAEGLTDLHKKTENSRWLVVSGGDQEELRKLFIKRGLFDLFDGGIFGSPDAKEKILIRELNKKNIENPAVFLGDSRYDHKAALIAGIDFLFISGWTEFPEWQNYCRSNNIVSIEKVGDLL